jgi:hypothetical protein
VLHRSESQTHLSTGFFFPPFSISFSSVFFDFSFLFLLRQLFSISCIFIFSPSFLWLVTSAGIYTYTYAAERNESCVACSQIPKDLFFHENARLSEVMEHLSTTYQMKSPGVTTTDKQGRNRTLYLPNVSSIEERTRPNLKKTLKGTTNSRPDADDAVLVEVVVAPAASCLAPGGGPHPPCFIIHFGRRRRRRLRRRRLLGVYYIYNLQMEQVGKE